MSKKESKNSEPMQKATREQKKCQKKVRRVKEE